MSEVECPRTETTGRPRERESGTRVRSFSAERVLNAEPVQFGRAVPTLGEQVDAKSRRGMFPLLVVLYLFVFSLPP